VARVEAVAISAIKMEKPKIRMLVNYTGETRLAQRPTLNPSDSRAVQAAASDRVEAS